MIGHTIYVPQNSDIFVNVMNYINYNYKSTILNESNSTGQRTTVYSGKYKFKITIDYVNK